MDYKYQLIVLGQNKLLKNKVLSLFFEEIKELGISKNNFRIISTDNFKDFKNNEPSYCIFFGNTANKNSYSEILERLKNDAVPILPVVENLNNVCKVLPAVLHKINALEIKAKCECSKIVSRILEGLSLLRKTRKVFISYKRDESSTVALQLFEMFERHGFDVFLDTHSVSPAKDFQEELFHRMVDCDVVLMLYTKNFFSSKWTKEEFDKANSMSIGIVKFVWPDVQADASAKLFIPFNLTETDFCDAGLQRLTIWSLQNAVNCIESVRARCLAARKSNIVNEFIKSAKNLNISYIHQPNDLIVMENFKGNKNVLVIPTVGIPQSMHYRFSKEFIESSKFSEAFLLYDHTYIRERWLNYLSWLDKYLPIKTVKVAEVEEWLK